MKKALITGATRGIGRAIAEELGKDHHIYAGASKDASEVVSALPSADPFEADLTDTDAILRAASQIEELGEIETPIVLTNTLSVAEGVAGAGEHPEVGGAVAVGQGPGVAARQDQVVPVPS